MFKIGDIAYVANPDSLFWHRVGSVVAVNGDNVTLRLTLGQGKHDFGAEELDLVQS